MEYCKTCGSRVLFHLGKIQVCTEFLLCGLFLAFMLGVITTILFNSVRG